MFVHHPDPNFKQTVQVGAYRVPFADGRAEVTQPRVLLQLQHAGYAVSEDRRRPNDAGQHEVTTAPILAPDPVDGSDGDDD